MEISRSARLRTSVRSAGTQLVRYRRRSGLQAQLDHEASKTITKEFPELIRLVEDRREQAAHVA